MSPVKLNAGSLFEHMRHICLRPRMFAPDFTLNHLSLYIRETEYEIIIQKPKRRSKRSPRSRR